MNNKPECLIDWIWKTGGIKYRGRHGKSYEGELRDLFTDCQANGKLRRARGVPATLLNNKTGRGLDEIVDEANSAGFSVYDDDHLVELIGLDIRAKATNDISSSVVRMSDVCLQEEVLWQQYLNGEVI